KDKSGNVIYVGKALSLKKRVRSYFSDISRHRTHALVSHVDTIDYIITDSEQEALLLEANLIKLHLPRYNINLKDDKKYPYIKITLKEDFPTVISTRDLSDRNAVYFGPYTNAKKMRHALRTATRVFPVRICRRMPKRVCALFYMGRCSAPCEGKIDKDDYRKLIQEMVDFLSGKGNKIEKRLKKELEIYKDNLEFEKAIIIRNRLKALEDIKRKQRIVLKTDKNIDVFGLSRKKRTAIVAVIKIRNGRMIGIEHYALNVVSEDSDESIIDTFFVQYYKDTFYIPDEVILPCIGEQMLLENWVRDRAKRKIKIKVPKKGIRFSLIKLAEENALVHIEEESSERIP
ncbi:excinuclease ABC subunit C, partial [candidate division WOR-3 bacterium]|nr:excinuclease ABC subunit C [candidate division WOR-3 bacterium]